MKITKSDCVYRIDNAAVRNTPDLLARLEILGAEIVSMPMRTIWGAVGGVNFRAKTNITPAMINAVTDKEIRLWERANKLEQAIKKHEELPHTWRFWKKD